MSPTNTCPPRPNAGVAVTAAATVAVHTTAPVAAFSAHTALWLEPTITSPDADRTGDDVTAPSKLTANRVSTVGPGAPTYGDLPSCVYQCPSWPHGCMNGDGDGDTLGVTDGVGVDVDDSEKLAVRLTVAEAEGVAVEVVVPDDVTVGVGDCVEVGVGPGLTATNAHTL